jgi:hypothetical protein
MKQILKTHTRHQIATTCGVSYRTVLNWFKLETMPIWALKRLGYDIHHGVK